MTALELVVILAALAASTLVLLQVRARVLRCEECQQTAILVDERTESLGNNVVISELTYRCPECGRMITHDYRFYDCSDPWL